MECLARLLDSVRGAAPGRACRTVCRRHAEQQRELRNQPARGQDVGAPDLGLRKLAPGDLVGVGGENEAVDQDDLTALQRRRDHLRHELGARGEKEQCFGARPYRARRVEQQVPDLVAQLRASRLTHPHTRHSARSQPIVQQPELRGLPHTLRPLEDDQPPALHPHPRVMIGLAAPLRMPSRIHSFTRTMTLSKFSCAVTTL